MNYRHGYHAGGFADVLKHTALCELLRLLTAKDKKLFVLDSHAGAGGYDLAGGQAQRTGEAEAGIVRLAAAQRGTKGAGVPPAVVRYLAAVAAARELAAFKPLTLDLSLAGIEPGRLSACALAVINPPWRFEEAMREALPWIAERLGPGVRAAICAPPASAPARASAG